MSARDRHHMDLRGLARLKKACSVLGLAVVAGTAAAPKPAHAEDPYYKATFGRLLEGFGFKSSSDANEINYQERSPLVIPSNLDLPPPEKAAAVANPAWPKDPDVTRRQLTEKLEKNRNISDEREREQNPLRPEELAPGPRPRGAKAVTNVDTADPSGFSRLLSPSELGYKGGLFGKMFHGKDNDVGQFTGEPPRTALTEPPPGYQTPSPDQPYGVGKYTPKAEDNYAHRGELQR